MDAIALVKQRAHERSADFIEAHGANALLFSRKAKVLDYVSGQIPTAGLMMECGVFKGGSVNHMARLLPDRQLFGFDSFEGLSERWPGMNHEAGHFDLGGVFPQVEDNVTLIKGWVDDTLPPFLDNNAGPIAYLHVDTDTYSPAKTILGLCKHRLVEGSVLLFDELIGYPNWEQAEYKALSEEIPADSYEFIAFSPMQAAVRFLKAPV